MQFVVRGFTAITLGRLFLRAVGQPVNGLVVQRVGIDVNVVVWKIAAC